MQLLDLPPELFQAIAHELVGLAGPSGAWKLRGVCRTFSAEIAHDIIYKRSTIAFKSSADRRLLEECVDQYLVARLRSPLDTNRRILKKLGKLVRWASRKLGVTSDEKIEAVTNQICTALELSAGSARLAHAIRCSSKGCYTRWYQWYKLTLDVHDKLSVALAIGSYETMENRLPELRDCQHRPASWFEFAPLRIGLDLGNTILIKQAIQWLKHMARERSHISSEIIQCLYRSPLLENMVTETITRYYHQSFCDLLELCESHLPRPQQYTFDRWVSKAVMRIDNDDKTTQQFIKSLLDFKPRGGSMVNHNTFGTVAAQGNPELIKTVAKLRRRGINTGNFNDLPLLVAVRSRNPLAVDAIVAAGANVNISVRRGMSRKNKNRLTPLDVAIRNQDRRVVKCLLLHGAGPIPHVSTWPLRKDFYPFMRTLLWQIEGVEVPPFWQLKRLDREERRAIKYGIYSA